MPVSAFEQIHALVQDTRRRRALTSDAEAFVHLCLQRVLRLDGDAITVAVTHGALDGGIDAVHIDHAGAHVPTCEYDGAHVVACDYADNPAESRRPIPRARLDSLAKTWVAIASSTDDELTLNPRLRQRIAALHGHWQSVESTHVPHDIYLITNREQARVDRTALERRMDYYMGHFYHYCEQADLVHALLAPA